MKLFNFGYLFVTLLFLVHNGFAQDFGILEPSTETIETGLDNRSLAMGKTTATTSRSCNAIFSNPSILGTFTKPQVQVGGKFLYGIVTNEVARADGSYQSYNARYSPFPNRSSLAVAVPFRSSDPRWQLAFGVGYQRNEGAKGEIEAVWSEERGEALKGEIVNINGSRRGALSTFTPGVALNVQNRFFCGITLSRTLGAITYTNELKLADHHTKVDEEQQQSAQFLRLGALAKVNPELSIAFMYRPSFEWEFGEMITNREENGELETERDPTQTELTIPTMWGIGAEYKFYSDFSVALELQSRPFSELQWSGDGNQRIFFENGFNVAIGAEYLGTGFPLRFGIFREAIPFVDENDTAPVSLVGLTVGAGSNRDKSFSWDVSALYGTWEQANAVGQKYAENLIRANVSVTYRFNSGGGTSTTSKGEIK